MAARPVGGITLPLAPSESPLVGALGLPPRPRCRACHDSSVPAAPIAPVAEFTSPLFPEPVTFYVAFAIGQPAGLIYLCGPCLAAAVEQVTERLHAALKPDS